MGVEPFLVASSLVVVIAQRLCRKICPHCKEEITIDQHVLNELPFDIKPGTKFYHGKGCDICNQMGYWGRMGIAEILEVDDDIRQLLLADKTAAEIKQYACEKKGMKTLWLDAMEKCLAGETTLEEVLRVTSHE